MACLLATIPEDILNKPEYLKAKSTGQFSAFSYQPINQTENDGSSVHVLNTSSLLICNVYYRHSHLAGSIDMFSFQLMSTVCGCLACSSHAAESVCPSCPWCIILSIFQLAGAILDDCNSASLDQSVRLSVYTSKMSCHVQYCYHGI